MVIPGFVDTHRHTWETNIRTCAPDFALITYFSAILDKFAPHYRPEDVHSATQWGALECLDYVCLEAVAGLSEAEGLEQALGDHVSMTIHLGIDMVHEVSERALEPGPGAAPKG